MVRFIIHKIFVMSIYDSLIYIPLWLDLLSRYNKRACSFLNNLHSTMVRFIMYFILRLSSPVINIYIPLWLDLLYVILISLTLKKINLHSTMVRFIIDITFSENNIEINLHSTMVRFIISYKRVAAFGEKRFTFHYG